MNTNENDQNVVVTVDSDGSYYRPLNIEVDLLDAELAHDFLYLTLVETQKDTQTELLATGIKILMHIGQFKLIQEFKNNPKKFVYPTSKSFKIINNW